MRFLGAPRCPARPHLLLRAVRQRWRRGLHVQNGLADLHMMDIFLLRVKVDRVAEIVISCPTAYRPLLLVAAGWGSATI